MSYVQWMNPKPQLGKFGCRIFDLKGDELFHHYGPKEKMIAAVKYSMKKTSKEYETQECINGGFMVRLYQGKI